MRIVLTCASNSTACNAKCRRVIVQLGVASNSLSANRGSTRVYGRAESSRDSGHQPEEVLSRIALDILPRRDKQRGSVQPPVARP